MRRPSPGSKTLDYSSGINCIRISYQLQIHRYKLFIVYPSVTIELWPQADARTKSITLCVEGALMSRRSFHPGISSRFDIVPSVHTKSCSRGDAHPRVTGCNADL